MNLENRIALMKRLQVYMLSDDIEWKEVQFKAYDKNPWFNQSFISIAVNNICTAFLEEDKLRVWANHYSIPDNTAKSKTIGIVMAGNLPLVGFHDFLSVFIYGYNMKIKLSVKDEVLLKHLIDKLIEWDKKLFDKIIIAHQLKNCDAYIATGSNNSSRYFEYYFGRYLSIIRKNKTSIAILDGDETQEQLHHLAKDICLYYGFGCRNVTKIYIPVDYNFIPLLKTLDDYIDFIDFHKYKHNYDYQLAILLMNNRVYMTNGSVILAENESFFSAVSTLHYSFYENKISLIESLKSNPDIQCMVGRGLIDFGAAQYPSLTDYADGVDTIEWLSRI